MFKLLVELCGCAAIVVGVAMWSVPLALVAAGLIVVAAVEVRG